MRAVVVADEVGKVVLRDLPDPEVIEPTDAVVRITQTAICGSDLHYLHGKVPLEPGEQIGHEVVGVVEAIGPQVSQIAVGDRVVGSFMVACGSCWFCERGQSQLCDDYAILGTGAFGMRLGGAQAQMLRMPWADTNLLKLPDEVSDELAVFVGDTLATAVYGISLGGVRPGDTVAIVGAGPVGLLHAQVAKRAGASQVVIVDRDPRRSEAAAGPAGGYATTIDPARRHPGAALDELTDGRGADVVIEAVGTVPALEASMDLVRRGGTVAVLGVFSIEQLDLNLGPAWSQAISLRFAGLTPVHSHWHETLEAVRDGSLDPLAIVSHRMSLEEAPRGYEIFEAREATKVLLTP